MTSSSTFVLVPGAGGVAAYWNLVVAELSDRGHEAIAVDLPGDDESATLARYGELITAAATGRDGVILVAQSLGGFSAPLAATAMPGCRLVLLNAMIPAPGETPGAWWENTGQVEAKRDKDIREGRDPDAPIDLPMYFLHDVPAELFEEVMSTSRPESDSVFVDPWPLVAWPDVPTTVIAAEEDRLFPVDFQVRVARERLGLDAHTMPGGHLVALSRPTELVDLLVDTQLRS
jgi:pimeloyl-ACP methyl ester carboxylesterase